MRHHETSGSGARARRTRAGGSTRCAVASASAFDAAAVALRAALLAAATVAALFAYARTARAQAAPGLDGAPDSTGSQAGAPAGAPADAPADTPGAPSATVPATIAPAPPATIAPGPVPARPARVGQRKVRLVGSTHNVVRSGPGNSFAIAGVHPKDSTFPVVAKSGEWYNVRLSETETGWVHSSLCLEFDDLSDLEFRPNPKQYTRTGSFVLGGYGGAYAFDRKSNSLVLGGRLGYYVFDRLQVEGGLGWTHVHRPAEIVESLFGLSLEADDFQMLFYQLDVVLEILPGRQMVPFVSAGVGSAIMKGETESSVNFGAGTMLFLSKRVATRWEFRDYRFDFGPDAARVSNDNVEFSVGTVVLF